MKKTFEIYYNSPEGIKSTFITSDESPEKIITQFIKYGITIEKAQHMLYIPSHSIIAITHWTAKG